MFNLNDDKASLKSTFKKAKTPVVVVYKKAL